MKQKITGLIALGVFAVVIESVAPPVNNWFAFGASAVEFSKLVERVASFDAIAPAICTFIEFIF